MAERKVETIAAGAARPAQLDALTCLRGPAALAVVFYHFDVGIFQDLNLPLFLPFVAHYYLGVDLFFILSGFILSHVHGSDFTRLAPRAALHFYALRLIRIYPVHATMMLAFLGLFLAQRLLGPALGIELRKSLDFYSADAFIRHMLLVQPYLMSWNYPAWSVSAEWIAYLGFPALAVALLRLPRAGCVAVLAALVAGFAFVYGTALDFSLDQNGLSRVAFEFVAGVLLWRLCWGAPGKSVLPGVIAAGVVALLLMQTRLFDLGCVLGLGALIAFAGSPLAVTSRWRLPASLLWLGEVSYSIYMVQAFVMGTLGRVFEKLMPHLPHLAQYALIPLLLGAVIAGGAVLHALVEKPARTKLRRLLDRHEGVARKEVGETAAVYR